MKTLCTLIVFLCVAGPIFAQNLPEKPQPRTADAQFWIETGALGAAWMADAISTHNGFAASPYNREGGPLFTGSRSTAKVMGAWAAVDVGAAVADYEWKKHVHNRYLHPLWHVFMVDRIEGHAQAAVYNFSYE